MAVITYPCPKPKSGLANRYERGPNMENPSKIHAIFHQGPDLVSVFGTLALNPYHIFGTFLQWVQ